MNYHKYFQYIYLVIAALFLFDAVSKFINHEVFWISLLLAGSALFMFFFKRKFSKKFDQSQKK